jgi:glycosyltransferase involved in cell wall biosynthesis
MEAIGGKMTVSVATFREPTKILVGIPALDEEVAIGSVALRSRKYAENVVVVDDCCTDNTAEIAILAGTEIIPHKTNEGKGAGIRDIFSHAREMNADIIVLIDGDGQHDPDDIPLLLEPLLNGRADMVIGSRFLARTKDHVPLYRRFGQEALTLATNLVAGIHVTDSQSGFRAFSKKAFDCFSFEHRGIEIESVMIIEAVRAGLRIVEVPVSVRYDVNGSSYHPVPHGLRVLSYVIGHPAAKRPLVFFGLAGAILLLAGIGSLYLAWGAFNNTGDIAIGYALACILFTILGTGSVFSAIYHFGEKRQQKSAQ